MKIILYRIMINNNNKINNNKICSMKLHIKHYNHCIYDNMLFMII